MMGKQMKCFLVMCSLPRSNFFRLIIALFMTSLIYNEEIGGRKKNKRLLFYSIALHMSTKKKIH